MLPGKRRIRDAASVEHETEETALDGRATDPSANACAPAVVAAYRILRAALGARPSRSSLGSVPTTTSPTGCWKYPLAQRSSFSNRRIEQRLRVDDIAHALETPRVDRARLSDTDHNPDGGGASERYPDARAGTHRRCRIRARRQVVERVPDRHRHRDLENRFGRRHPAAGGCNRVRSMRESAEQVDIDP